MRRDRKKKGWVRFRHRVITGIARVLLHPYSRFKYGIKVERFREKGKRQYVIVMNHQTAFDQFFVGIAFKGAVYYLASEDLFSKGWVSVLIKYLVAPISIKKQTMDFSAVINCLRVAREGGTIALAPEGNRTYSGKTEYFNPSIVRFIRKLNLPLAIFRIEGGYGVHPRWSDVIRKGSMRAYVYRVVEPDEYAKLSDDELFEIIRKGIHVNEACVSGSFKHKRLAEYLERAMYVCAYCGLSTFESHDDIIECKKCGRRIRYLPTKELYGEGFDFPFRFVSDWYDYQCDFVNDLDVTLHTKEPVYRDTACMLEVILYKEKKQLQLNAPISLYGNRIAIAENSTDEVVFPFDEVSALTVLGRNKLNIYFEDRVYQLKGDCRFNALKYVNFYYRYKNIVGGDANGKFLGL